MHWQRDVAGCAADHFAALDVLTDLHDRVGGCAYVLRERDHQLRRHRRRGDGRAGDEILVVFKMQSAGEVGPVEQRGTAHNSASSVEGPRAQRGDLSVASRCRHELESRWGTVVERLMPPRRAARLRPAPARSRSVASAAPAPS